MVYQKTVTVPTPGVPQPLSSSRTPAVWIQVQANSNNSDTAFVVALNPATKTQGTIAGGGQEVAAGGVVTFPPCSAVNFYDLANIYVDVTGANDGFKILYAVR